MVGGSRLSDHPEGRADTAEGSSYLILHLLIPFNSDNDTVIDTVFGRRRLTHSAETVGCPATDHQGPCAIAVADGSAASP
jgi:hypothetical protein